MKEEQQKSTILNEEIRNQPVTSYMYIIYFNLIKLS